ncbi:MAG: NAD(P)/FAD-dependent oxidoreductase [Dissulfurispiraceae bacterium]
MVDQTVYDCIIVGAGPGGLQAAIYLGRYNRKVLIIDRSGGRTMHARHIENFLTQKAISGKEIIALGMEQAKNFNVGIERSTVTRILKKGHFEVYAGDAAYYAKSVIISTGVNDNLPQVENVYKFLGTSFFTCVDCDGYRTVGKKLVVIGNSIYTVRLAFAMKEMYTKDVTLILVSFDPPEDFREALQDEGITLVKGQPVRILGSEQMEAVEMEDGRKICCESVMSNFGFKLNDNFLSELHLTRDSRAFKYQTDHNYESSVRGLYIVGPLNTGHDQVVIAAGEGAVAAIEINKNLLDL